MKTTTTKCPISKPPYMPYPQTHLLKFQIKTSVLGSLYRYTNISTHTYYTYMHTINRHLSKQCGCIWCTCIQIQTHTHTQVDIYLRKAQQPTPVFLYGESHGQSSLVGYGPQGHRESDTTEVTQHAQVHTSLYLSILSKHRKQQEILGLIENTTVAIYRELTLCQVSF